MQALQDQDAVYFVGTNASESQKATSTSCPSFNRSHTEEERCSTAMHSLDVSSDGRNWRSWASSPQVAFNTLFVQYIVHFVFSPIALMMTVMAVMGFDAQGTSGDPIREREVWLNGWWGMGLFSLFFVPAPVLASMGVVVGAVWLKGQTLEAQKQVLLYETSHQHHACTSCL
jgi:hypothetical protein